MRSKWIVVAALLIAIVGVGIVLYQLLLQRTEITLVVTVSDATNESLLSEVNVVVNGDTVKTNKDGKAKFIEQVAEGDTLIVALFGRRETRVIRRGISGGDLVEGARTINLPIKLMDAPVELPAGGTLQVVSTPSAGVTLTIDEGPPSDLPATIKLSLGTHVLRFEKEGYSTLDTTVTINMDNSALDVSLTEEVSTPSAGETMPPEEKTTEGKATDKSTKKHKVVHPPSAETTEGPDKSAPVAEKLPGCLEEVLASLEGDAAVIQALENCDDASFSQENKGLRQFLLGQAYLNSGNGEKAIFMLKTYIARYGRNDPLGYYLLGDAETRYGDLQAAIDAYKEVEKRKYNIESRKQRDSICGESLFGEALAYAQMSKQPNNQYASENAQNAESLFEEFIGDYCGTHPKCGAANKHLKELKER
jgi:hypothetical protein